MARSVQVFSAKSDDGNSSSYTLPADEFEFDVSGTGTFTVKLQHSPDAGTTWIDTDSTNASFTSSGAAKVTLTAGLLVRLNQADSSGASVDAWLVFPN